MGANSFFTRGKGKTMQEAFRAAADDARWESGHGGYTGTIAEKHGAVLITPIARIPADEYVNVVMGIGQELGGREVWDEARRDYRREPFAVEQLDEWSRKTYDKFGPLTAAEVSRIHRDWETVDDKWGPAGVVQVGPDEWLFFGMASS